MELDLFKQDCETFIRECAGPNNAKVSEAAGLFIAQKLRERSFARQIITPRIVSRMDLQVATDHDQLVFIDEKEVNVGPAKAINFKAEPDGNYVTTPRYQIPIFEIASDIYAKKEIELRITNLKANIKHYENFIETYKWKKDKDEKELQELLEKLESEKDKN
jgi:hypothetical protein